MTREHSTFIVILRGFRITFVTVEKQHAKYMRRIILLYVACPAVLQFSTLCHKRKDFRKKKKSCNKISVCVRVL
jgi:hypothetical protein